MGQEAGHDQASCCPCKALQMLMRYTWLGISWYLHCRKPANFISSISDDRGEDPRCNASPILSLGFWLSYVQYSWLFSDKQSKNNTNKSKSLSGAHPLSVTRTSTHLTFRIWNIFSCLYFGMGPARNSRWRITLRTYCDDVEKYYSYIEVAGACLFKHTLCSN